MSTNEKFALWSLLVIALASSILGTIYYSKCVNVMSPEVILSPLLVLSVISLILALTFTTAVFQILGLTNKNQSLGLPEGSIRAVVALSLILIFMLSSVFIYNQLATPSTYESTDVPKDMIHVFPNESILSIKLNKTDDNCNETFYDVILMVKKTAASEDIAKQIITTVATLVVAIASFYFGTRAVSVASGVTLVSEPLIRSIEPKEGKQGENVDELKIQGKNFELGNTGEVKLVLGEEKISCTDILSSPTKINCKFIIPKTAVAGKWSVIVINADKGEDRLESAFEIKT